MDGFATVFYSLGILLAAFTQDCIGIGCFVCHSVDGVNTPCEDPFNATDENLYIKDCLTHKRNHDGNFPADHCIKIDGVRAKNSSKSIVIRTCAMDSGSLTADTEIVRMSHCGHFYIGDDYYGGCVQSCGHDGCNVASSLKAGNKQNILCFFEFKSTIIASIVFNLFSQLLYRQ